MRLIKRICALILHRKVHMASFVLCIPLRKLNHPEDDNFGLLINAKFIEHRILVPRTTACMLGSLKIEATYEHKPTERLAVASFVTIIHGFPGVRCPVEPSP